MVQAISQTWGGIERSSAVRLQTCPCGARSNAQSLMCTRDLLALLWGYAAEWHTVLSVSKHSLPSHYISLTICCVSAAYDLSAFPKLTEKTIKSIEDVLTQDIPALVRCALLASSAHAAGSCQLCSGCSAVQAIRQPLGAAGRLGGVLPAAVRAGC